MCIRDNDAGALIRLAGNALLRYDAAHGEQKLLVLFVADAAADSQGIGLKDIHQVYDPGA